MRALCQSKIISRRNCRTIIIVLLSAVMAGCGQSGPELIPVSGVVTIDGKPASEGGVTFYGVNDPNVQLVGSIAPDGKYTIRRRQEEGAPAGEYRVTVLITETAKRPDGSYTGLPKTISNPRFSDPNASPLKVTVTDDAPPGAYDLAVTK